MRDESSTAAPNRRRRTGVILFLVTAIVYLGTAGYDRTNVDVLGANVGAWRIASTGHLWIEDLDVSTINKTKVGMTVREHDGHTVIARSGGVVAANLPAYLIREVVADPGTSPDDFSNVPGTITAALLTAISVLLFWGALLRLTTRRIATAGAVVLAFATPVWSVPADGMWTHTITVLGIAGMAFAAARDRWLLVGTFAGIAAWGRLHTALIAAVLALTCSYVQRRPRIAIQTAAMGGLFVAGASAWSHWFYGQWLPAGGYTASTYVDRTDSTLDFTSTPGKFLANEAGLWVAPDRGILVWTPLILVLLPTLVRCWRDVPAWARALLAAGVAYTAIQGWVNAFHGGDGFYGYRLGLEFLVCAAPALVMAATHTGRRTRVVLTAVVGVQLAAFTIGGVFNRPTLPMGTPWEDNAFVHALVGAPVLLVIVAIVVAGTFLVTRMFLSEPEPATAGDLPAN